MGNVTTDQQLAALRQQLAQAQARVQAGMNTQGARNDMGSAPGGGARGGSEVTAGTADMNRINQQIAALGGFGQPGAGAGGISMDPIANSANRVSDLTNDPVDAMIRQRLQDVMGGKAAPYDQTTKNALFTSQADQAGAGEAARNQQIMDQVAMNGGSMNDPSAHAAINESMLQRQLANQGAHLNVDMNANTANFNAAQQATGALAANNNAHQSQITQASQFLTGQLDQRTTQLPSFAQFQSGFSGGESPSAANIHGSSFTYNPGPSEGYMSSGRPQNTTGTQGNPAFALQDPYGGQGAPAQQRQPQWGDEPAKWTGGLSAPIIGSALPQGMGVNRRRIPGLATNADQYQN